MQVRDLSLSLSLSLIPTSTMALPSSLSQVLEAITDWTTELAESLVSPSTSQQLRAADWSITSLPRSGSSLSNLRHAFDLLPIAPTATSVTMDYLPWIARQPTFLEKAWTAVTYPINLLANPFQALMSIPALSFLVIPAFTSYGTSFNFLFFYLTWAILIRSNDPLKVELLGTLGIRVIFYILPSLGFLVFDSATPNLAVGIKEHGDKALPMGDDQGGKRGRWWKITLISILNVLIGVAIQAAIELLFTQVLHIRSALKISTTPPFPWSIAKDLFLALLLREILTYALHRYALHAPKSPLTKMHTSWQHSIVAPFSFVAHYDNPLTYLLHVFLPTYVPALVLRMHLLTYHLYLVIVSVEEVFAYSGYNVLPTAFILGGIARRQERHLMGKEAGNFGCFGLMDFALGTSLGADLMDDVVDEADDKDVSKKLKGKGKAAKKKTRKAIEDKEPEKEDVNEDKSNDDVAEEGGEEKEDAPPAKPKRKTSGKATKSKQTNEEKEDAGHEVKDEDKKPKRKASRAKVS